jgi:hypothetical protein
VTRLRASCSLHGGEAIRKRITVFFAAARGGPSANLSALQAPRIGSLTSMIKGVVVAQNAVLLQF